MEYELSKVFEIYLETCAKDAIKGRNLAKKCGNVFLTIYYEAEQILQQIKIQMEQRKMLTDEFSTNLLYLDFQIKNLFITLNSKIQKMLEYLDS